MSYTAQTLTNDTYEALKAANPSLPASVLPRLVILVPDALELLAKRVKSSNDYEGLQKDFSVTPTAGRVDLTALSGILFDINKSRVRVSSSNASIQVIDSYETLEHGGLPNDRVYAAQDGGELVFRSTTPSISDYVTAVKIKANYIPSIAEVPTQYDGALLSTMVELARRPEVPQIAAAGARELAEIGRA